MSKLCEDCIKSDVCSLKEETMRNVNHLNNIAAMDSKNLWLDITCKKWEHIITNKRGI